LPSDEADGKFDPALAQHEDAARRLAFDKQHGTLGICDGILNSFESLQRSGGKIAKDMFCPHLAAQAAFYDLQSVWCKHDEPPVTHDVSPLTYDRMAM
jgi:hypothetical protein